MTEVYNLKDILDFIDNGITNNNDKDHYILYISVIHTFFLNRNGIDFGIRYDLLKQANLIITKLIDQENGDLREDWLNLRYLIVPGLIKEDEKLTDDDRYKYKLPVFIQNSSLINDE